MRDPNPLQSLRTALGLIAGSNLLTDPESLPGIFEAYECFYSGQPDHLAVVDDIKTTWKAGSLPEVPVSYRRVLLNEPEPVDDRFRSAPKPSLVLPPYNLGDEPPAKAKTSSPSRRRRKPTLASIAKEAAKAGLEVARYEVDPDGKIIVVTGKPGEANTAADPNPWDEVLNDPDQKRTSEALHARHRSARQTPRALPQSRLHHLSDRHSLVRRLHAPICGGGRGH